MICIHAHTHTHIHTRTHIHSLTVSLSLSHTHTFAHTHTHACSHIHICMHLCIHIYISTDEPCKYIYSLTEPRDYHDANKIDGPRTFTQAPSFLGTGWLYTDLKMHHVRYVRYDTHVNLPFHMGHHDTYMSHCARINWSCIHRYMMHISRKSHKANRYIHICVQIFVYTYVYIYTCMYVYL